MTAGGGGGACPCLPPPIYVPCTPLVQFVLSTFSTHTEIFPDFHYGLLVDNFENTCSLEEYLKICKNYKFFNFGLNKKLINSEIINKIKKNNLIITTYSENNIELIEANDLWKLGVTSIFIDDPSLFEL